MYKKNPKRKEPIICDYCGRIFEFKSLLIRHLTVHTPQILNKVDELSCGECNLVFKNKGLLMCHNVKIHGAKSTSRKVENKYKHICKVCQKNFFFLKDLKLHIREFHFNLLSHLPYCDLKKVNQVWFEKVLNSKNIVEIKKVGENILLMRKLDDNTAMKVSDHTTEVIDLHYLYPTQCKDNIQCQYCLRLYDKGYITKHIADVHLKYNHKEVTDQ